MNLIRVFDICTSGSIKRFEVIPWLAARSSQKLVVGVKVWLIEGLGVEVKVVVGKEVRLLVKQTIMLVV